MAGCFSRRKAFFHSLVRRAGSDLCSVPAVMRNFPSDGLLCQSLCGAHDSPDVRTAQQAARRAPCERPPCTEWHLLGLAVWGVLARPATELRALSHLLQSLCSLAPGAHAPVQEPSTASIAYIGRRHD